MFFFVQILPEWSDLADANKIIAGLRLLNIMIL